MRPSHRRLEQPSPMPVRRVSSIDSGGQRQYSLPAVTRKPWLIGKGGTMVAFRALAAAVAISLLAAAASAATWDMPTPYPENNFHTVNILQFADEVKAATGGELTIKVHSNGSLFKHPEIKGAVRGGQVPIGEILLSRLSNENAVFDIDSVPFVATDYAQARKLWAASRPSIEKLLDAEGLTVLFSVAWPPQGLFTAKPVAVTDDLKGLKFRAYNAATERLAQLAGAVPTQVEAPDIPQAFLTGRVEAMITSPSTGANSKAWDFVSHYYNTQAWLPKNIVFVNKRAFRGLDEATRKAVLEASQRAEQRGWEMSEKETAEKTALLATNGMKVAEPSAPLKEGLTRFGQVMAEEWLQKAGADGRTILDSFRR
jgi:TRAP-type C4-dicarboxylate transport system substrate-binding protein